MSLDLILSIVAAVLLVVGLIGTVVPVLPGAPLAWSGLLCAFFSGNNKISLLCLIITALCAIFVSVMDNMFPVLMTKKNGGSKAAVTGSTIGLIAGFFMGPPGIIIGPFIGALIGELINTNGEFNLAVKSAWGAFIGFLLGTGLKIITVMIFIWIYILSFRA